MGSTNSVAVLQILTSTQVFRGLMHALKDPNALKDLRSFVAFIEHLYKLFVMAR